MSKREMTVKYLKEMVEKSFANVDIDDKGKMCVLPYQSLVDTVDLYEDKLAWQEVEIQRLTEEKAELQKQVDELKAKIEHGTLIELPCKVGDTVYCVYLSKKLFDISEAEEEYFIKEDVVSGYYFDGKDVLVKMVMMPIMHDLRYILKGSFQTREEAEKLLKELQE